jgi:hypothetical protein
MLIGILVARTTAVPKTIPFRYSFVLTTPEIKALIVEKTPYVESLSAQLLRKKVGTKGTMRHLVSASLASLAFKILIIS